METQTSQWSKSNMATKRRKPAKLSGPDVITEIWTDIRQLRDNSSTEHAAVNTRIDDLNSVVTSKFTEVDEKLGEQTAKLTKHMDDSVEKLSAGIMAVLEKFDGRLDNLEQWKWTIIGAASVVGFFIIDVLGRALVETQFIKNLFHIGQQVIQ